MSIKQIVKPLNLLLVMLTLSWHLSSYARPTDISDTPLAARVSSSSVPPALMFILDASGSMEYDYTPDAVGTSFQIDYHEHRHFCYDAAGSNPLGQHGDGGDTLEVNTVQTNNNDVCIVGDPPYFSPDINKQYYNPDVRYSLPVCHDGPCAGFGNITATNAPTNPYGDIVNTDFPDFDAKRDQLGKKRDTIDLTTEYPERLWCKTPQNGGSINMSECRANKNGYDYPDDTYKYGGWLTRGTEAAGYGFSYIYDTVYMGKTAPYYYRLKPTEYCKTVDLIDCIKAKSDFTSSDPTNYPVPAIVRWCAGPSDTDNNEATTNCQARHDDNHTVPRYLGLLEENNTGTPATASFTITDADPSLVITEIHRNGERTSRLIDEYAPIYGTGDPVTTAQAICREINITGRYAGLDGDRIGYTAGTGLSNNDCSADSATVNVSPILYWRTTNSNILVIRGPGGSTSSGVIGYAPSRIRFEGRIDPVAGVPTTTTRTGQGTFERIDIVAGKNYPKTANRTDCAAASHCTYAEELQNFANWYSYYRTRMNAMKTTAGQAFQQLSSSVNVGFITINAPAFKDDGGISSSSADFNKKFLAIDTFYGSHKDNFYQKLYSQQTRGLTPLREALSLVGRYFAHKIDGPNVYMTDDPLKYECQKNYALLTTDGYWNMHNGFDLNNQGFNTSQDSLAPRPFYDGRQSSDSLSDVAYYYYDTDLRADKTDTQRMITYTLGFGIDGNMRYSPDYEELSTTSDYRHIRTDTPVSASTCPWQIGTSVSSSYCEWPSPSAQTQSAVDDLWHTAVNGRGKYFSAQDAVSLSSGLTNILANIRAISLAGAGSSVSLPQLTGAENYAYSASYNPSTWAGNVTAYSIDLTDGKVEVPGKWNVRDKLDAKISADPNADNRVIYTFDSADTTGGKLKDFKWDDLTSTEKNWFMQGCTTIPKLSQCTSSNSGTLENGESLVNYLRGATAAVSSFRPRQHVLGDIIHANPVYVRLPARNYKDATNPSYSSFKASQTSRRGMIYVAANDGMLHAFSAPLDPTAAGAKPGEELWAYVPRMLFPDLYRLADNAYSSAHRYFIDATPVVSDVFGAVNGGTTGWHTILVGGLGKGGRGYYALDVTDPENPKALWEFCHDSTRCDESDADLGLTFGQPIITKLPCSSDPTASCNDKWVVIFSSGYNNESPGDGKGHFYVVDALTGKPVIEDSNSNDIVKFSTTAGSTGSTGTPSGLAKITGWVNNVLEDNTIRAVYGGDLLGNVWKFTIDQSQGTVKKLAEARDSAQKPQSITVAPELSRIPNYNGRVVYVATGRLLGNCDVTPISSNSDCADPPGVDVTSQTQSIYAFKDDESLQYTTNAGLRASAAKLVQQELSVSPHNDALDTDLTITNNPVDWATNNGWYLDLALTGAITNTGERVNLDMNLILGTLVVTSNTPQIAQNSQCSAVDNQLSRVYLLDYKTGSYADKDKQIVSHKVADQVAVAADVFRLPNGQVKYVATVQKGDSNTGNAGGGGNDDVTAVRMLPVAVPTIANGQPPGVVSWREVIRDHF